MDSFTAGFAGRVSTELVPPAARIDFWNEVSTRVFGPVRVASRSREQFHGEMQRIVLRDFELLSIKSSPISLLRNSRAVSREDSNTPWPLVIICSGEGRAEIEGQEMALRPGDFLLMTPDASNSYYFDEAPHVITLFLDARRVASRMSRIAHRLNQRMRSDCSGTSFLPSFFQANWNALSEGYQASWSDSLSDAFWNLFDLAFADRSCSSAPSYRKPDLLKAALRLIEDELNDPEFGVHQIANALNVSARYVQLLFSDLAITPTQYLLQRRLEVAADQLCRGSSTRIGELALSVGFNDMAYFSRAFRKHFGSSARTFRLHNCQRINRSAEFV